jgi:hypothetical protein
MAGYSGTPLPKKLGIKASARVALVSAPAGFDDVLGELPPDVALAQELAGRAPFDVIVFFTASRAELAKRFASVARRLTEAGGLWIAWPKKAAKMETDLTEDVVRAIGLDAGLVDNKVCAIDEVWSGLRFVVRVRDRVVRSLKKKPLPPA